MKSCCLVLFLVIIGCYCNAQAPPNPTGCSSGGGNTSLTISGTSSFTFSSIAQFSSSQNSNGITVSVKSNSSNYTLYVAGVVTALPSSSTNTVIPIGTFSVGASKPGSAPTSVVLSNLYQPIAVNGKTSGSSVDAQVITIALNPAGNMDSFQQAPGTHVLTLYFCLCN